MEKFKGTPGPWSEYREGFSTVYIEARLRDAVIQEVAACGPTEAGSEQQSANARLIAAAPELLEALQFIQSKMSDFINLANNVGINDADGFYLAAATDAQQKAQAAIKKALGEKQ